MRRKIDFIYIDAGEGHRAAAKALAAVIGERELPWDLEFLCIQDLLDSIDYIRKSVGIPFQDLYNILLAAGLDAGNSARRAGRGVGGAQLLEDRRRGSGTAGAGTAPPVPGVHCRYAKPRGIRDSGGAGRNSIAERLSE